MSSMQPADFGAAAPEGGSQNAQDFGAAVNQFAPPVSAGETAVPMEANPFARPISSGEANPFARPVDSEPQTGETAQRRRASRMERYRDVDNGTDAEA